MIRQKQAGYTIVEVMIFLAVTTGLFIIANAAFSGQNERTQFSQAVRGTESQIQDWINDVNTGYYPDVAFNCSKGGNTQPTISSGSYGQGTRDGCIFVGKVVRFKDSRHISLDTLAGNREKATGGEVESIEDTNPKTVDDIRENFSTQYNFPIERVFLNDTSNTRLGSFAVVTTFGKAAGADLVSGSSSSQVVPITGDIGQIDSEYAASLQALATPTQNLPITVCMKSGNGKDWGVIVIGSAGGKLSTTSIITQAPPIGCTS
jgi:hypothetical protein